MALPDIESLLLERFTLFHRNVEGIVSVSKTPQANTLDKHDAPHMTHLIGPSGTIPTSGQQRILIPRTITARLSVVEVGTGEDVAGQGALGNLLALPFYSILRIAYLRSPRLALPGHDDFPYLAEDIQFRDSGLLPKLGPGGATYWTIDWTIDCVLSLVLPEPDDDDDLEAGGLYDQFGLS